MIAVIDYGMGNIASILNMYKRIGKRDVFLTKDPAVIKSAEKIILPGVGAFDNGMKNLHESGLIPLLNERVLVERIPVLGICLGMQLLFDKSEEGNEAGLGWIEGEVCKFQQNETSSLKIPHMGWNYITPVKPSPLFFDTKSKMKFYFVHSYYARCKHPEDVIAKCDYNVKFDCAVQKGNIFGVQFHPEKSHKFGMDLLDRFSKI